MTHDGWDRIERGLGAEETEKIRARIDAADKKRQEEQAARLAAERAEQEKPEVLERQRQAQAREYARKF
jgi:hypothetical protein